MGLRLGLGLGFDHADLKPGLSPDRISSPSLGAQLEPRQAVGERQPVHG